jgi:hypothetical protein
VRITRAVMAGTLAALLSATAAQAATHELSVTSRLADRRAVTAGTRAYSTAFEDGRFYPTGWHIAGEMSGIWTPPLKLADGVWFGVAGQWTAPATRFTSGFGYTRTTFPAIDGLELSRTDFAPDGRRAMLFGLELRNPGGAAKRTTVSVDAHSELMGAWPWGTDPGRNAPSAADDLPDTGSFDGNALVFRDRGALPGAAAHDWAALVGSPDKPRSGVTGPGFRGPQQARARICTTDAADAKLMPSDCDDTSYGHGTGGELRYRVKVPAHGSRTVWVAVAGSDQGLGAARKELAGALRRPAAQLAAKIAERQSLARNSRVDLPGDRLLQRSVLWGTQNLADLTQTAKNLKVRWTQQGKAPEAPVSGTVKSATFFGAGFPDYPWLFATDGEYTNFAAVALGRFATAEAHLRALRDVSEAVNGRNSGVVMHETVTDGSVYFGHDSKTTADDGTVTNDFNTDELVKYPSAVALVWRWTGDGKFLKDLYPFARRTAHAAVERFDADGDGWPEGSGNVERTGMGAEKLDNAAYLIRGLTDLADMAKARGDARTVTFARTAAAKERASFESTWWDAAAGQYADSLKDPGNQQVFQKHWIGVVPMEAELVSGGRTTPGLATAAHGAAALAQREGACYSSDRPYSRGLFHTGCGGGADGKGDLESFSLNTAIQAVGEGNYGRLGPDQQRRYSDTDAETMFSEPANGGTPDEQPGAMPEILPSVGFDAEGDQDKNIDRCWTCRSMVMQAWGNYGTVWPVVHQQLGVRPSLGLRRLEIVPQVPTGQPRVSGTNIRLGTGAADVLASHSGRRFTTTVSVHGLGLRTLRVGHTLPAGTRVGRVVLDGHRVTRYRARTTNRGVEVTVAAPGARGRHTLVVTAAA